MARYIDADKLVETIERYVEPYKTWDCTKFDVAMEAVDDTPAADVVEVKHGEWRQTTEPCGAWDVDCVECSLCGESWITDEDFDFDFVKDFWNYCPNCGAKMDGGEKDG